MKRIVRILSRWAWADELFQIESYVRLRELHAKDGAMELEIEQRPEAAVWVAKCLASLVATSPNYTEMTLEHKSCRYPITVTVQKVKGKTPHQLRLEAERERDELKARLAKLSANTGVSGTGPSAGRGTENGLVGRGDNP